MQCIALQTNESGGSEVEESSFSEERRASKADSTASLPSSSSFPALASCRDASVFLALVPSETSLQTLFLLPNSSVSASFLLPASSPTSTFRTSSADHRLVSLLVDRSWCRHVEA